MKRVTINGLETYYGPLPTAFKLESSPYGADYHYIAPWWVFPLNRYHRDNLVQLLDMILNNDLLFGCFNTGDWINDILQMLAKPVLVGTNVRAAFHLDEDDHPNLTSESIEDRLVLALAVKISRVDGIDIELAKEHARRYLDA